MEEIQSDNFENSEEFKKGMKATIDDLRLAAIKAGYSLEDIDDKQIEGWVKRTVITEDPLKKLTLLKYHIEEHGKKLPPKEEVHI